MITTNRPEYEGLTKEEKEEIERIMEQAAKGDPADTPIAGFADNGTNDNPELSDSRFTKFFKSHLSPLNNFTALNKSLAVAAVAEPLNFEGYASLMTKSRQFNDNCEMAYYVIGETRADTDVNGKRYISPYNVSLNSAIRNHFHLYAKSEKPVVLSSAELRKTYYVAKYALKQNYNALLTQHHTWGKEVEPSRVRWMKKLSPVFVKEMSGFELMATAQAEVYAIKDASVLEQIKNSLI